MDRRWLLLAYAPALAGCGDLHAGSAAIAADATHVTCVNPSGGAAWAFELDRARGLVSGRPARIHGDRISWTDPVDGSSYELDTASGELTMTRASSTGGYMVNYRCSGARPGR